MLFPAATIVRSPPLFLLAVMLLGSTHLMAEDGMSGLLQDVAVVSEQELSRNRGGADLHVEDIVLQLGEVTADASISNNTLTALSTGSNTVESGAFAGAAGVVFAVQNTGNHVIIQNTTLINVTMNP